MERRLLARLVRLPAFKSLISKRATWINRTINRIASYSCRGSSSASAILRTIPLMRDSAVATSIPRDRPDRFGTISASHSARIVRYIGRASSYAATEARSRGARVISGADTLTCETRDAQPLLWSSTHRGSHARRTMTRSERGDDQRLGIGPSRTARRFSLLETERKINTSDYQPACPSLVNNSLDSEFGATRSGSASRITRRRQRRGPRPLLSAPFSNSPSDARRRYPEIRATRITPQRLFFSLFVFLRLLRPRT
jgi:hypothetical protein